MRTTVFAATLALWATAAPARAQYVTTSFYVTPSGYYSNPYAYGYYPYAYNPYTVPGYSAYYPSPNYGLNYGYPSYYRGYYGRGYYSPSYYGGYYGRGYYGRRW